MNSAEFLRALHSRRGLRAGAIRAVLSAASGVYGLAIAIRSLAFSLGWASSRELPAPVVSVGNVTTGGTGKTPAVIWIAESLRRICDRRPVILSRGYGQDEIRLLAECLPDVPHFTGKNRHLAGRQALSALGSELVFVLDDGFQHRSLRRDLEIVLVDASDPFGLGRLLPCGFLREPWKTLRRADVLLVTKCDLVPPDFLRNLSEVLGRIAPGATQVLSEHMPAGLRRWGEEGSHPLESIRGSEILSFAGIGNPESFHRTLARLGAHVIVKRNFPDHHRYTPQDLEELEREALESGARALVTSAKDAVKLDRSKGISLPLWILDIRLKISRGEKELLDSLANAAFRKGETGNAEQQS